MYWPGRNHEGLIWLKAKLLSTRDAHLFHVKRTHLHISMRRQGKIQPNRRRYFLLPVFQECSHGGSVLSFKLYFLVTFHSFPLKCFHTLLWKETCWTKTTGVPEGMYTGEWRASCVWTTEPLTIASNTYFQIHS